VPDLEGARARLERAKRDLARAEGELEGFEKEKKAARERLRELLGCEAGGERTALAELQKQVEEGDAEVARLLSEVRAADAERAAPEVS
jgi:outer membrane protein TolC